MNMLKERLNPCATLLYHWIRYHEGNQNTFDLNLEHFQVWTAEFLEEAASVKDIDQALLRLMQLQLIRVEAHGITTVAPTDQPAVKIAPMPNKLSKMWTWENRLTKSGVAIAASVVLLISGLALFKVVQRNAKNLPTAETIEQLNK